ncbi:MAG TPA: hypothetical protein QF901_09090 [Gammaproteobacteria bacterium]|nr:hypothetical protein [Gammaproteobacteria bacterium]
MEKIGYVLLAIVALCGLGVVIYVMVAAFPYGIIGFVGIAGVGCLFIKLLAERLSNKEDDYYSKKVKK